MENAFGILCAGWRMFYTLIRAKVENIENYVNASYCPNGFTVSYDATGNLQQGEWRDLVSGNWGQCQ